MSNELAQIQHPIREELDTFERKFRESVKSNVALLDRVMYYIVKRKGKQVRPMFVMLSAQLCGKIGEPTYVAASLIELLHTATLVHDDVVDDAYMRRGFFSINHLWKNKIAVLVGDYLLSKGLLLSLESGQTQILQITSTAVLEMAEGELLQMEKARKLDIQESIYFDIIRRKTASLIAASCAAGAASTITDAETIERLRQFGELIGIAFQIKDDLFDYGPDDVGKPTGIDIKERKMTLPLIYALSKANRSDKRRIISLVKGGGDDREKVNEVIGFVQASGGMDYARQAMYQYQERAFVLLREFDPSPTRDSLEQLVRYVTEREK
ncbi:MAG: polyprenyl synthetase family protein [Bacteroidetes bacterium]|nr:polyprenyl synthetase family protein [Bacteroidota bacterium]